MAQHDDQSRCKIPQANECLAPFFVFVGLIAIGILARWLIDIPNFQPVAAIALFCGFYFRRYWAAFATVLAVLAISDSVLGGYQWQMMLFVYASLLLPVLGGSYWIHREQPAFRFWGRILIGSLITSSIFFLISNWAFWQFSNVYPKSTSGLAECYAAALPFLRFTVLSDLAFSASFFVTWQLAVSRLVGFLPSPARRSSI